MNDNSVPNITDLQGLLKDAGLSQTSLSVIIDNLDGNQAALLGTTGLNVNDIFVDDQTVIVFVIDVSGSMERYRDALIDGFNGIKRALRDSKLEDSVVASVWFFNSKPQLVHNFRPLADVVELDRNNCQPNGTTALYDATLNAMTGLVAYVTDLQNNGVTAKGIVVVISDGEDNSSNSTTAKIQVVAQDMLDSEIFTLAFFAFGYNGEPVARAMGFNNVMQTGNTDSELRRALGTISKSIIRASQTKIGTSQNFFS